MALHNKKEFADKCNLTTGNLSVYIDRKKIELSGEMIDDTLDKNIAFINRRVSKGKMQPINNLTLSKQETKKEIKKPDANTEQVKFDFPPSENSLTEAEKTQKRLSNIKTEMEIERLQFDLEKKRGEVIPTELIKPILIQNNQSFVNEFKNAADEIIRSFTKKYDVNVNDVAEIKGQLLSIINSAIIKAGDQTLKSIEAIINEFANKKNVGEHG